MNKTLLRKELREARWKLVVGTGILAVMALLLPLAYEFIKDLIATVPSEQMDMYRHLMPINILDNYSIYIWSQWNAKNLTQLGTILAILVGMNLIAGEVNDKTASFLLSRPIARRTVFFTKALAGALILVLAVAISSIVLLVAVHLSPHSLEAGRLMVTTLITLLGLLVIYALTMFYSSLIDEPVKAGAIALVSVLAISVLGFFTQTRKLSLFTHMYGTQYFIGGTFPLLPVVIMSVAIVLLLGAGLYIFENKEI